jgi:SpoVK/Ycf46/Vps4 family AAA+-type ATPase
VLPDNTLRQLHEIADAIGQRERVYHDWRMLERTGQSAGLAILFTGSSGTGKTMAASVVANAAGLDLYRIDLASVVSKYIGETEQNLDRIFSAAHGSNAILLFDEADALMGKRSEVKDAHDRYANLEVAYLLQKLEEHDGVAILASNLPKNLDSAFTRRIHYTLEFGRPNALLRERLWRGMFGPAVPLADDIDWRFLAEKFETTGGEIQAIALDAAFLAAARDEPVSMPHLMHAMARRQTKQGNPGGLARFEAHRASMNQSQASGFDA